MLATLVTDEASNCIVRAAHPTLGLELNVGFQAAFWTADIAVVAEFVLHLAKKDTPRVHVWLRNETVR